MTSSVSLKRPPIWRRLCVRSLAVFLGLALAAAAGELVVRWYAPQALARVSTVHEAGPEESPLHPVHGLYAVDEELGFRPRLGGPFADTHGCQANAYALDKAPGHARVLFVGDSVTRRGALVRGLQQTWGEEGIEYWNAGVEGYGLHQVDRYHARFLTGLDADHVVLTFHVNDFTATPVTFLDGDRLVVHATKLSSARTNRWLFRYSQLYRLWLSRRLMREEDGSAAPLAEVVDEVEASLVALRDRVEASGARFTVLLFPWLAPPEEWPAHVRSAHANALAMLERHEIRHFDLAQALGVALSAGQVVREREKDPEHPSDAFGLHVAQTLARAGLTPR